MNPKMDNETLSENVERQVKAIDLCLENHLRMPALILIYSGIDIFAALGRPREKESTTREEYIQWCERYMLKDGNLPCAAIDLYAARCGVVHTYTMNSQLSKDGKAKEIIYSWGNQSAESLQDVINILGKPIYVVHLDSLADSFKKGVEKFLSEVSKDQKQLDLVVSRAQKLFKDQPKEFWR